MASPPCCSPCSPAGSPTLRSVAIRTSSDRFELPPPWRKPCRGRKTPRERAYATLFCSAALARETGRYHRNPVEPEADDTPLTRRKIRRSPRTRQTRHRVVAESLGRFEFFAATDPYPPAGTAAHGSGSPRVSRAGNALRQRNRADPCLAYAP